MGNMNGESISVIIPFYKGNAYIDGLIKNIADIRDKTNANITDIIFVNDSPWEDIKLPILASDFSVVVTVLKNEQNYGIQKSRVRGLDACSTPLFIFLDQDDALLSDGFDDQVKLIQDADVVVGNGLYQYGEEFKPIYKNEKAMKYLVQKKRFIEIRNLIPSPGCCLFRRESIPQEWKESYMKVNGADDWYLWLLMFAEGKNFAVNGGMVYQHNSTDAGNLSADLEKMHQSSVEMYENLKTDAILTEKELRILRRTIEFKYLQDTGRLSLMKCFGYLRPIMDNIGYKIWLAIA